MMTGVSIIGNFKKKQFSETTEKEPEPYDIQLLSAMSNNILGKSTKKEQNEEKKDKDVFYNRILPKKFKYRLPKQQALQSNIKRSKWLNI